MVDRERYSIFRVDYLSPSLANPAVRLKIPQQQMVIKQPTQTEDIRPNIAQKY
jgi:hypothetical protein